MQSIIKRLWYYYFVLFSHFSFFYFTAHHQTLTLVFSLFFSFLIFSFILQILSSVVFCLLLGREGKKPKPQTRQRNKKSCGKNAQRFYHELVFSVHISLSPKGVNTAY